MQLIYIQAGKQMFSTLQTFTMPFIFNAICRGKPTVAIAVTNVRMVDAVVLFITLVLPLTSF